MVRRARTTRIPVPESVKYQNNLSPGIIKIEGLYQGYIVKKSRVS
jgi:hypothetical protein